MDVPFNGRSLKIGASTAFSGKRYLPLKRSSGRDGLYGSIAALLDGVAEGPWRLVECCKSLSVRAHEVARPSGLQSGRKRWMA